MYTRPSAVAGSWYAGTSSSLKRQIEQECFLHDLGPKEIPKINPEGERKIQALLCPHAGYMYSGPIAAHAYRALAKDGEPPVIVIVGPNHTGVGSGVSIMVEGIWKTPLGEVSIDSDLAKAIQKNSSYIDIDNYAHESEHSIELQLPFIQYVIGSGFKFVPICMSLQELDVALDVGQAVAKALTDVNAVIIASSDMTHYESQTSAERKDQMAIDAMKKLDAEELYQIVSNLNISMCGVGPAIAAITASKIRKAEIGVLLKYATSGDITGDRRVVVGYSSMAFLKP
ncbi:MAG: AmmeMemoRadiSam system protein B [Candidatus Bathyarchaeota archaeon]